VTLVPTALGPAFEAARFLVEPPLGASLAARFVFAAGALFFAPVAFEADG
jgi:hypothetical protein